MNKISKLKLLTILSLVCAYNEISEGYLLHRKDCFTLERLTLFFKITCN